MDLLRIGFSPINPNHFADLFMQFFSATRTALHVEELCPNAWAVIFYITEIKKVRSLRSCDVKIPGKAGLDTPKSEWNSIMWSIDQAYSLEMSLPFSSSIVIEIIYWRMHCFKERTARLFSGKHSEALCQLNLLELFPQKHSKCHVGRSCLIFFDVWKQKNNIEEFRNWTV